MARLRTLHVGTRTVGDVTEDQHILVLDGLTPDQLQHDFETHDGFPPILAFGFDVDLPGVDPARWVMPTRKPDQDARIVLVLGRTSIDASSLADQIQQVTKDELEVCILAVARLPGLPPSLPPGLISPVVVRTPEYVALPDDHEGKARIEEELRRVDAKRAPADLTRETFDIVGPPHRA
ncbi:hypothetical protein [Nocardiopsis synnemataformans]|uniref:hypothetical protein n=1 Tax=Nocardiopsis synnemataformans TaxID=61305 RepID=UPI003EBCB4DD